MTSALLPVGQRPKCRACGRELKPNFDVERGKTRIVRRYTRKVVDYSQGYVYDHPTKVVPVTERDHEAKQAKDGRWYQEDEVTEKIRTFRGTYGRYADSMFCGQLCAYKWAVSVCKKLEAEGDYWITYKKKGGGS